MSLKNILHSKLQLSEKISEVRKINNSKNTKGLQCLYAINNEAYNNYIKIGSTITPERRKLDYKTYSPYEHKYLWIVYLEDFNCYLCDELIKLELDEYNIKENGGTEFYNISKIDIVLNILNQYQITYQVEYGDKFENKIENDSSNFISNSTNMDQTRLLELLESLNPEQLNLLNSMGGAAGGEVSPENDIANYKYRYIKQHLDNLETYGNLDELVTASQSLSFFIERIKKNISDIIILGMIQSGKTSEIIQMTYFCIRYLKIPVIILIQNKTSGYLQLEHRIKEFSDDLSNYNIPCKYVKTGLKKTSSLKVFDIENPSTQVYICLSNYKQLEKVEQNLKHVKIMNKRMKPYALIMDEYDDLIKSRQDDLDLAPKCRVEPHIQYLRENSFINVGVTATLLAPMLSDNVITIDNIYQLTPGPLYVGMGSNRIIINDITPYIQCKNSRREIHSKDVINLVSKMDKEINYEERDYCLLLINISDKKEEHDTLFQRLRNDYDSWSHILFHSAEDNRIRCTLPTLESSKIKYIEGFYDDDADINIVKEDIRIPEEIFMLYKFHNYELKQTHFSRYTIDFTNKTIQDVITTLFKFTDKISVISGRMACRGISFVDNNYERHITDMIYVPSGKSHVTRNVQDMRIYGNFKEDGIKINLYVDELIYKKEIKNYLTLQNELLQGNVNYNGDDNEEAPTMKENIMTYFFDSENLPSKKLDRNKLVKGFSFNSQNSWGIPTNFTEIEPCIEHIERTYPTFEIKIMTLKYRKLLESDNLFTIPTQSNQLSKSKYNQFVKDNLDEFNEYITRFGIKKLHEHDIGLYYILENYKNGWLLHNPISIEENINVFKRTALKSICYLGKENGNYMDLVFRNHRFSRNLKDNLGKNIILIFWGMGCYHIFKCDKDFFYMKDRLS